MPSMAVRGQHLWIEDVGVGDPVVLLHGAMGTARDDLGGLIDFLADHFRVLAPDLRGYGRSMPKPRAFEADFYIQDALDVGALLDVLDLPPAHVLGYSDGGEVALLVAVRRPDRVRSVIAWGVAGALGREILPIAAEYDSPEAWASLRAVWRADIMARHGDENFEPMAIGWARAVRAMVAEGGDISLGQAHEISCPVLLINGASDAGNPPYMVRQLGERIPWCSLEIWQGLGHPVHQEVPRRFHERVLAFLRECPV
jgi:pimeloyl-ACP methyl ester carboxylesterase